LLEPSAGGYTYFTCTPRVRRRCARGPSRDAEVHAKGSAHISMPSESKNGNGKVQQGCVHWRTAFQRALFLTTGARQGPVLGSDAHTALTGTSRLKSVSERLFMVYRSCVRETGSTKRASPSPVLSVGSQWLSKQVLDVFLRSRSLFASMMTHSFSTRALFGAGNPCLGATGLHPC
jgi:hypothetical protein